MADNINEIIKKQNDAILRIEKEMQSITENEINIIGERQRIAMEGLKRQQESEFKYKTRLLEQLTDTLNRQKDTLFLLEGELAAVAENDFEKHRAALRLEIEKLKAEHENAIEKVSVSHDAALAAITARHDAALAKLSEEQDIEKIKSEHVV
ncbi:MAG: hypothetical protein LBI27_09235, partial [Clostridiales bacterium]|nr:hypothetical protein [Clostridiales bacterium]